MLNKKVLLFMIILIGVTGLISALVESLPTQKQWDEVNLIQSCANSTWANITKVLYPNSTFALRGEIPMDALGNDYNYTFTNTSVIGQYLVYGHCNEDGIDTFWAYDFYVNPSGFDGTLWIYITIFVISTFLIIFGFKIKDNWIIIFGGFGFIFLGLYILFNGIVGLKDPVYTWASGLIILTVGSYFGIRGSLEVIYY